MDQSDRREDEVRWSPEMVARLAKVFPRPSEGPPSPEVDGEEGEAVRFPVAILQGAVVGGGGEVPPGTGLWVLAIIDNNGQVQTCDVLPHVEECSSIPDAVWGGALAYAMRNGARSLYGLLGGTLLNSVLIAHDDEQGPHVYEGVEFSPNPTLPATAIVGGPVLQEIGRARRSGQPSHTGAGGSSAIVTVEGAEAAANAVAVEGCVVHRQEWRVRAVVWTDCSTGQPRADDVAEALKELAIKPGGLEDGKHKIVVEENLFHVRVEVLDRDGKADVTLSPEAGTEPA